VLDIALIEDRKLMLVSLDNKLSYSHTLPPRIEVLELQIEFRDKVWQFEWLEHDCPLEEVRGAEAGSRDDIASKLKHTLQSAEEVRHEIEVDENAKPRALYSPLGEFLYGLENLRKKSHGDGDGQEVNETAAINPEEI
jgi:hypothetical protein